MPLQRPNSRGLVEVPPLAACGDRLDELLGPSLGRPGDLHHPTPIAVPEELASAARAVGLPTSIALSVVVEHVLVTREVAGEPTLANALLDHAAAAPPRLALSPVHARYVRTLTAALNGRLAAHREDDPALVVVPTRLADRLRAAPELELEAAALRRALTWELAAVRCGRTMTEWALGELLAARYPESASRHELAAASAAR